MTKKEKDVLKYLKIMKVDESFKALTRLIFNNLGILSREGCDELMEKVVTDEAIEELLCRYVPVYSERFTHSEIKELIRFFSSSAGEKYVTNINGIMGTSESVGSLWATEVLTKHQADIEEIAERDADRRFNSDLSNLPIQDN